MIDTSHYSLIITNIVYRSVHILTYIIMYLNSIIYHVIYIIKLCVFMKYLIVFILNNKNHKPVPNSNPNLCES